MSTQKTLIEFLPTEITEVDGKQYFLWDLTEEVKTDIETLLEVNNIKYAWNKSREIIPQFKCHECGEKISFADMIRGALKVLPDNHTTDIFVKILENRGNMGNGREHILYCKNGHKQIPVMGWALIIWDEF